MANPYKQVPIDRAGTPMQQYAGYVALKTDSSENNTASSVISFNDNATTVEVAAIGAAAAIRWITAGNTNPSVISAATTANLDHIVDPNTVRRFVIPIETVGTSSIVGLGVQAGLYRRMAVKSVAAASVITTQY